MSLSEAEMNTLMTDVATIKETNRQILKQTTETNGRVTELENWKNQAIGGFIVLSFISGTGLVLYILDLLKGK